VTATVALICENCGETFYVPPVDGWKTMCRACFRGDVNAKALVHQLQSEVADLRRQLTRPRLSAPSGFDIKQWQRLVQLRHPDKHQGSAASVTATQWLLSVRKEFDT
jgi:hypothetical protein